MNNKGQTLVLFVLILPIIMVFLSFFVDLVKVNYERDRVNNILRSNLQVIVNNDIKDIEEIKNIYLENNIIVDVFIEDDFITIDTNMKLKSVFGKLLNFDVYKIHTCYKGNYLNKEVKYEKD